MGVSFPHQKWRGKFIVALLCYLRHPSGQAENHSRMFGPGAVLPRSAHSLFMHGRNDPVLDVDPPSPLLLFLKAKHSNNVREVLEL